MRGSERSGADGIRNEPAVSEVDDDKNINDMKKKKCISVDVSMGTVIGLVALFKFWGRWGW